MSLPAKANRDRAYYEHLVRRHHPDHCPDCDCTQCWSSPVSCIQCTQEFRSLRALRKHSNASHSGKLTKAERRKAVAKQILVPDGMGFLQRVLANADTVKRLNLESISRFADALAKKRTGIGHGRPSFTKAHRAELLRLETLGGTSTVTSPLPEEASLAVFRMACASHVSPAYITAALACYGLEYLSQELRKHPVAPEHAVIPVPVKKEVNEYFRPKSPNATKNDGPNKPLF